MMPDKMIAVKRKQVPTPMNMAAPRLPNPRQIENTKEPKANIEVVLVRKMAFPVLANICFTFLLPSIRQGVRYLHHNLFRYRIFSAGNTVSKNYIRFNVDYPKN